MTQQIKINGIASALCGLLLALSQPLSAQVEFMRTQDFSAMQASAKESDKFIFIDAYTDWCGWCKVMDKNTFSDQGVAEYMKQRFESYKLEMEKDSLGKLLAMKYAITGFPSYIIINPEGTLHRILVGYMEIDAWLEELDEVMSSPTPNRPAISLSLKLEWPEFYLEAFGMSGKRKSPEKDVVLAFIAENRPDNEVAFTVTRRYSFWLSDEQSNAIFEQRKELSDAFGADLVDDLIQDILQGKINKQLAIDDEAALIEALDTYDFYFPDKKASRPYVYQAFYLKHKKYPELLDLVESNNEEFSPAAMNSLCWTLYTSCDDESLLEKAVVWMQDVVTKEPSYAYLDTYAALLYKTGSYSEAEKWALEAIQAGKAENEKVESTEKLLSDIRAAK